MLDRGCGSDGALRIAIVGLGPKGLFAFERLLDHTHRRGSRARLEIDLYEPHPIPGAGPVYDPAQPEYLRMNFAAEHLDMWWPQTRSVPARERLSFVDWRAAGEGNVDRAAARAEAYPPRAQVGCYLADGLARMLRHAPAGVAVTLRSSAVQALDWSASTWRVVMANDETHDYDELLLTVGHGTTIDELAARHWEHAAPLAGAVFPVEHRLSTVHVPAGAAVAVRGFALTFLDAALALTEGRGGAFEPGCRPHHLRYLATGADAGVIVPYSRSGRPMLAKPDPRLAAGIPALDSIAQEGSARILALSENFTVRGDLVAILASTVAAGLLAADGRTGTTSRRAIATARRWLEVACDGVAPPAGHSPAEELERSVAVAAGQHVPELAWALGHTWRSVYPALVARLGGAGLSERRWPAFRRLAAQMERVSFGPPLVNAAKLLALVEAGRVDLTHVAGGQIRTAGAITSIRGEHGERRVDVVVNAVLAAPGVTPAGDGLLSALVADGYARILPGRRGLDVRADAGAIGDGGCLTPGLSIIGRATEDCVIGNDTLSRSLHPHADQWALRVARRASGGGPPAPHYPPQGAAA